MKDNKLLAEYMEFETDGYNGFDYRSLQFNSNLCVWQPNKDWNHLMMVVEKIEKENGVVEFNIEGSDANIAYQDGEDRMWIIRSGKTKIEAVYNACVEYIKQ